jgi:26S proteasome regulatory subunit N6
LQANLIEQLVDAKDYKDAVEQGLGSPLHFTLPVSLLPCHFSASQLIKELKKINDNQTIVGVHLQQSKAFYGLSELDRARVAMSHARIAANYTNISTKLEACINMQMGILYAADDNDFKNAESYFQEAFKGFDTDAKKDYEPKLAVLALKYVLLSKVGVW